MVSKGLRDEANEMSGGMPVLREDDVVEGARDPVDDRQHLVAPLDGEAAAGRERVLHVHHEESCVASRPRHWLLATKFLFTPRA
jgi:hypothetical protein